ncbi:MAG: hypothetical protein G8345_06700 [Magnetococcales bacterium]|nr:hypothetical protein [Magnetococcales bacterium]NGZ26560.1 hypothetical protein [Magnetococcales bacterium]
MLIVREMQYSEAATRRLLPYFQQKNLAFPPHAITMAFFKHEKRMELYAAGADQVMMPIRSYPLLGISGHLGPKLREGDGQVPEGGYRIVHLNPMSAFHLSLKLDYPNSFDREQALVEKRDSLGDNIMIHGGNQSVGCLAIGNEAIEEIFILTQFVGMERVNVLVAPIDFRAGHPWPVGQPVVKSSFSDQLYRNLAAQLALLPPPAPPSPG